MLFVKYFMLFLILVASVLLGKNIARKYVNRLKELEEMRTALNIFRSKVSFTYSPIPEIFEEIAKDSKGNIGKIFSVASKKMEMVTANIAWSEAINEVDSNLNKEDKKILENLSKLLGQTDVEGQISQIDITQKFLDNQIQDAIDEKQKNEKLYSKLGITIGLAIVVVLAWNWLWWIDFVPWERDDSKNGYKFII